MIISERGINFIKSFEGCKLTAYRDVAGILTIGWGTTRYPGGFPICEGDTIDQSDADNYLFTEIEGIEKKLESFLIIDLPQNKHDAVVSFCYNVGMNGFKISTLLRKINANEPILESNFTDWNKIHQDGKLIPSKGLTRRRKEEYAMFAGE